MSDSNGGKQQTWKQRLEIMGAPDWYIAGEVRRDVLHLELANRIGALEQLTISHAASAIAEGKSAGNKSGAAAGRRWGTFFAAFTIAAVTALGQCNPAPVRLGPLGNHSGGSQ